MTRHNGLFPASTCYGLVVYVADLLRGSHQLVTDLLRENCCNGFWPLLIFCCLPASIAPGFLRCSDLCMSNGHSFLWPQIFQILRTSLPNSAAHCFIFSNIVINFYGSLNLTKYALFVASNHSCLGRGRHYKVIVPPPSHATVVAGDK